MSWSTPIIDRSLSDVEFAMLNQNSTANLKGAWNISDANRVINNTIYLNDRLTEYGYGVTLTPIPLFIETDLPYVVSKMKIIRDNVNKVSNAFYKLHHKTIVYGDVFSYVDANTLEINLKSTNDLLESMISCFKYSGVTISGEELNI